MEMRNWHGGIAKVMGKLKNIKHGRKVTIKAYGWSQSNNNKKTFKESMIRMAGEDNC